MSKYRSEYFQAIDRRIQYVNSNFLIDVELSDAKKGGHEIAYVKPHDISQMELSRIYSLLSAEYQPASAVSVMLRYITKNPEAKFKDIAAYRKLIPQETAFYLMKFTVHHKLNIATYYSPAPLRLIWGEMNPEKYDLIILHKCIHTYDLKKINCKYIYIYDFHADTDDQKNMLALMAAIDFVKPEANDNDKSANAKSANAKLDTFKTRAEILAELSKYNVIDEINLPNDAYAMLLSK